MRLINLIGFPHARLQEFLLEHRIEPYRAHQIFIWIYHYKVYDFDSMTNLSKALRALLGEHFHISSHGFRPKPHRRTVLSSTCSSWKTV